MLAAVLGCSSLLFFPAARRKELGREKGMRKMKRKENEGPHPFFPFPSLPPAVSIPHWKRDSPPALGGTRNGVPHGGELSHPHFVLGLSLPKLTMKLPYLCGKANTIRCYT